MLIGQSGQAARPQVMFSPEFSCSQIHPPNPEDRGADRLNLLFIKDCLRGLHQEHERGDRNLPNFTPAETENYLGIDPEIFLYRMDRG